MRQGEERGCDKRIKATPQCLRRLRRVRAAKTHPHRRRAREAIVERGDGGRAERDGECLELQMHVGGTRHSRLVLSETQKVG